MPLIPSAFVNLVMLILKLIHTANHMICSYITHLYFLSFEIDMFPECLKIAKVKLYLYLKLDLKRR